MHKGQIFQKGLWNKKPLYLPFLSHILSPSRFLQAFSIITYFSTDWYNSVMLKHVCLSMIDHDTYCFYHFSKATAYFFVFVHFSAWHIFPSNIYFYLTSLPSLLKCNLHWKVGVSKIAVFQPLHLLFLTVLTIAWHKFVPI